MKNAGLRGYSIRSRLLLLVLAIALTALAGIVWFVRHQEEQLRNEAYARLRLVARETATDIELYLREREGVMARMAARPMIKALDRNQCDPITREYAELEPEFTTIVVRNTQGEVICSLRPNVASASVALKSDWFQDGLRSAALHVSDAIVGPATGRAITILTYPVRDDAGNVVGLLAFPVDLLKLNAKLFASVPKDVVIPVFDRKDRFLLRSLDPEAWIGKTLPAPQAANVNGFTEGLLVAKDLQGVTRLYAGTTIGRTGWRIFVGLPEQEALAPARMLLLRTVVIALAILLLVVAIALRIASSIARPVRALAQTAVNVARGDYSARAALEGPQEIRAVAQEFNQMLEVRVQAESALRASESVLQEAQRLGRIGSYVLDIPSNTWTSSPMLDTIFGLETVGPRDLTVWEQLVHPDEREQMIAYFRSIVAEHAPFDKEYRIERMCDRETRWVWGIGTVEYDAHGMATRMVGCIQDITERKQTEMEKAVLESQIQQAQRMDSVGRLAGGVAHDFNNMLTVILGNVAMAIEQTEPSDPIYADLVEIRKAAQRSSDLTRQLLAFARKQVISPKVLNLNETVSGTISMLRRLIGENIKLEWSPEANLWPVKVDPSQIDQILANLCINARDAMAAGGNIAIETGNSSFDDDYCADHVGFLPGQYVRISVSDTGRGIEKEALAHIFEPFFTTKSAGEGTGLGLATVYGAVKQGNGFINVYSEPGRGTTFTIYFPRYEGQGGTEESAEPTALPGRGRGTVLLVEDEPAILNLAERILARQGYAVISAETPGAAIRSAEACAGAIHLLITDVVMPEMNGRDLAKELQMRYPSLKVLFMSGYTANIIVHQGVLDQGVQFIQKPFAVDDFAAKVRAALDS